MLNTYFGYGITLKSIVAFMKLFDNLKIYSYNENDDKLNAYKVPINFSSPEKYLAMKMNTVLNNDQNKDINQSNIESQLIVPRIAVSLTDILYDNTRKISQINKIYNINDKKNYVFSGVPYTLNFEVFILTKKVFDLFQIIEQILPIFQPGLSLDIEFIPNMGSESVLTRLDNISLEIPEDLSPEDERLISAQLTFTMKIHYYLPEFEGKIIKEIDINYHNLQTYKEFLKYVIFAKNNQPIYPEDERYKEPTTETEIYE